MDHKKKKIYLLANALITSEKREHILNDALTKIKKYEKTLNAKTPKAKKFRKIQQIIESDTTRKEFISMVERMKEHIIAGDVFQVVPSRTIITNYNAEPFDIYSELRKLNPSPYMFYINN